MPVVKPRLLHVHTICPLAVDAPSLALIIPLVSPPPSLISSAGLATNHHGRLQLCPPVLLQWMPPPSPSSSQSCTAACATALVSGCQPMAARAASAQVAGCCLGAVGLFTRTCRHEHMPGRGSVGPILRATPTMKFLNNMHASPLLGCR